MTKRILAMLMFSFMLVSALTACASTTPPQNTPGGDNGVDTDDVTVIELPELLPEGTWYDGLEFNILVSGNFKNNDFHYDTEVDSVVNQAKYQRIATLQDKYGIGIVYDDIIAFGSSGGAGKGYQALQTIYTSQTPDYHMSMIGTYDVSTAAYSGYLIDLNSEDMPYVDLTKSWWDQTANDSLMIANKMFYTTGDISLTDNIITNCIMFNKELIANTDGMQNPYEMVTNNEWTWENFTIEVKKISGMDEDGNGVMNHLDKYGLLTWNDAFLAAFSSSRSSFATINDDDEVELTAYTQVSNSMVSAYINLIQNTNSVFNYQTGYGSGQWDANRIAMFDEGRAAYSMTTFNTVPKHRNSQTDFGILPFPKLNAEQEQYGHLVSAYHCQFVCVPVVQSPDDIEMIGGVLEELAYLGQKNLTPAYYEQTLVGQYVRDDESVEMLDIIFSSAVYDLGIYYKVGQLSQTIMGMASSRQNTFASMYNSSLVSANSDIDKINDMFQNVLGNE